MTDTPRPGSAIDRFDRRITRLMADHGLTALRIALGIVFCMSVKPDLIGAVLAIVVAAALGFAASLPALNRERGRATVTETTA